MFHKSVDQGWGYPEEALEQKGCKSTKYFMRFGIKFNKKQMQ